MDRITLDSTFDRRLLPPTGGRRFLRLALRAPQLAETGFTTRKPLNLAFVLDRSGSMAGDKLALVKQAVAFGVKQLSAEDRAAVVTYDDRVRVLAESVPMTGDAKARIALDLGRVREGGSTALGEGWLTGCRLAAAAGTALGARWLTRSLLLTDGLANVGITDPHELMGHATALRQRGVSTTTFGVGDDFDEQLLRGLAEAGGGNFYFIAEAAQIPAFFAGELGELLTVFAELVTLTLELPAGVTAELLNDYPIKRSGASSATLTVELGNLSAGEEKDLVFELTAGPGSLDASLPIGIHLHYHQAIDNDAITVAAALALQHVAPPAAEAEQPELSVLELAGRLQAARAKYAAWEHTRAGRYREAQAVLQQTAHDLAAPAMAPAAPALASDAAELVGLAEQAATGWDQRTSKTALYSSHVARKSRRDYGKPS
jgi:Ca-activated chloride channel homolog